MRFTFATASCIAMSLSLAQLADAQGPVRRALRETGGAAEAGVRGAARARAGAARATAQGVRAGVDAVTPDRPIEARTGGDIDRNARGRFQQHNGDWWYYTPDNVWMYRRDD